MNIYGQENIKNPYITIYIYISREISLIKIIEK